MEQERQQLEIPSPLSPIPRTECMKDLAQFIGDLQAKCDALVLCIDANESPRESFTSTGPRAQSIEWLLDSTNMLEVFMEVHGQ